MSVSFVLNVSVFGVVAPAGMLLALMGSYSEEMRNVTYKYLKPWSIRYLAPRRPLKSSQSLLHCNDSGVLTVFLNAVWRRHAQS